MNRLLLLLLTLSLTALAGDLYQHIQAPLVDAYVDSSVVQEPDLPGMGETYYAISVSVSTMDANTVMFGIYLRVRLADGTEHVCRANVGRSGYGTTDPNTAATTYRFDLGESKPVKILAFNVARLHQEPVDQLIRP